MDGPSLITPTLHVEVQLSNAVPTTRIFHRDAREAVAEWLQSNYDTVHIGILDDIKILEHLDKIRSVHIADYTGPHEVTGYYSLAGTALDVQTYVLHLEQDTGERRSIKRDGDGGDAQARIVSLPNVALNEDWDSLVFDDGLPLRLLRYLVRMVAMMGQPGLNLATFNWNKICLLHGPPGSGKSTLCRALAQKLSIRLGDIFPRATLVEINANSMLSKYFGESGKLIESTFDQVEGIAQDRSKLVVIVIDEVETIASSRQRVSSNGESNDGLRASIQHISGLATNQLLTALDRFRSLPNIIVCCTSSLIDAIDPAFLDRVDIKQHVHSPSSAAVYNIFRSCLDKLLRSNVLSVSTNSTSTGRPTPLLQPSSKPAAQSSSPSPKRRRVRSSSTPVKESDAHVHESSSSSSSSSSSTVEETVGEEFCAIPTLATTLMSQCQDMSQPGHRVWLLAQKCQGLHFSGRTLRRLPVLGLAMYTWGGKVGIEEAIDALEEAVNEEVAAVKTDQ